METITVMRALLLAAFFFAALPAFAAERMEVCAKYTPSGKQYKVQATIISGSDLNTATRTFNYNSFSTYAVIFWDKDEASVIELDWGTVSVLGTNGRDQTGRSWEISSSTTICW
jgi:hypothetical protein